MHTAASVPCWHRRNDSSIAISDRYGLLIAFGLPGRR